MTALRNSTLGFLLLLVWQPGLADHDKRKTPHFCAPDTMPFNPKPVEVGKTIGEMPIDLEADQIDAPDKDTVVLSGNAMAVQGPMSVQADRLKYQKSTDELEAEGNVVIRTPNGDLINVTDLQLELESFIGTTGKAKFKTARRDGVFGGIPYRYEEEDEEEDQEMEVPAGRIQVGGRGTADKADIEGHDFVRLHKAAYTNCKEGQDDVFIYAKRLDLNQATGVGKAYNVQMSFKNVPIFIWPYISFPINNQRKSGFLYPGIGSKPNSGFIFETPYYWNIAPQADATITPRYFAKRGFQLEGEFRYLSENFDGIMAAEVLPSDDQANNEDRSAFSYEHDQTFSPRWDGDLKLQYVSDNEYFDDFSTNLDISSSTYLDQQGSVEYNGDIWRFGTRVTAYQTVDSTIAPSSEPYERLPQFLLEATPEFSESGFEWGFEAELVNFEQDVKVDGTRFDMTPSISYPMEKTYGEIVPKLSVRQTNYDLKDQAPGVDSNPSRTLPIFSIDSGLIFERDSSWGGEFHTHTLEPRLFYVYIPHDNQSGLPNFDTGNVEQNNLSTIFRENRFYGADRVGDTNQITAGLSSRLFSEEGVERMKASIGQIFFLEDRKVTSGGDSLDTDSTSDFLAEIEAWFTSHWRTYGFLQWDIEENQTTNGRAELRYTGRAGRKMELGYRFTRDSTEQVDFDFRWPLGDRWFVNFEERYSIRDEENLATSASLTYNKCCWGITIEAQRRRDSNSQNIDSIFFIMQFTGIANLRAGI